MYSATTLMSGYLQKKNNAKQTYQDLINGKATIKVGSKKHPSSHGRKILDIFHRKLTTKMWLNNKVIDALIEAYIDNNIDWFVIVCRYYTAPTSLLEIVKLLILGKFPDPQLLSSTDRSRIHKVIDIHEYRSSQYLHWIDTKIYYDGRTLVDKG